MRRLSLLFTALCAAFVSVACSSNDFYRARVESTGQANAQASRVKDGVESPVTARYSVEGYGVATAQSVKPYLTLDGAWTPDVSASNGTFEPDAVLVRPLPPEASTPRVIRTTLDGKPALLIPKRVVELRTVTTAPSAGGECLAGPDGLCDVSAAPGAASEVPCPTPAVVAAPLPTGRPCGTPVYIGCDGTPGGNRPTPGGTMKQIAPGTGWPCSKDVAGDPVLSALAIPPGFVIHVGGCFVKFLKCAVTPPDLGNASK